MRLEIKKQRKDKSLHIDKFDRHCAENKMTALNDKISDKNHFEAMNDRSYFASHFYQVIMQSEVSSKKHTAIKSHPKLTHNITSNLDSRHLQFFQQLLCSTVTEFLDKNHF